MNNTTASDLSEAAAALRAAADTLDQIRASGVYTIGEIREVRTSILRAIRELIDPLACGHMPDERHY